MKIDDDDSISLKDTDWDFHGWGWGGSIEDWEKVWRTISENGARVALDSVLQDEAFFTIDQLDDGDFEISVLAGPYLMRIKRSEFTSEDVDPSHVSAFTEIKVGDWRKDKTK